VEGEAMTGEQKTLFPKPEMNVLRDLDRSEVEPLAFKILQAIEPLCEKTQIAGSIRRRKGGVNDVDIVIQPKPERAAWLNIIKQIRSELFLAEVSEVLLEKLAAISHEEWVYWSKAISKTEVIKPETLARWQTLWVPYEQLPEEYKEADRLWAKKILELVTAKE
jgi:hypothetical protein